LLDPERRLVGIEDPDMQRQTPQRVAIESAFVSAGRPLGPQEVLDAARERVPSLNLATVYRTLKRMVEDGAIHPVTLPGEPARYELQAAAEHHHHHFRCHSCHAVFDLEGCVEGLKKLLPRGFRMTGHDIVLYGSCAACST
jgi:Fur family ferric uptake transcriptional regulator